LRTGGAVQVAIHNATSRFGEVTQQATQVANGTIDIALGLCGAEGGRFPRSAIVELPFLVRDAETGSHSLWRLHTNGVLGGEYQDYKLLALFVHNPGLIHTAAKPIVATADLKGVRLRAPNATAAAALASLGAAPFILQVNDVMPAVRDGRIDGIVTNWGNPLPGFNDAMTCHTEIAFYTSAFFVVMNRRKYESLPDDVRSAIDELSGAPLVTRFGLLWNKWDRPVRDGPTHQAIRSLFQTKRRSRNGGLHCDRPRTATWICWRQAASPMRVPPTTVLFPPSSAEWRYDCDSGDSTMQLVRPCARRWHACIAASRDSPVQRARYNCPRA
jgi:hypothetical protein